MVTDAEIAAMRRAVELAALGRPTTLPNPVVGCVIIDGQGRTVGEGWHHHPGGPHAEVNALTDAGDRASGATAVVTLEPCPMCAGAIVMADVDEVLFGAYDPRCGCAGSLYNLPEDAAFGRVTPCSGGLMEEACRRALDAFFDSKRS